MPKYLLACGLAVACAGAAVAADSKTEARHWQTAAEFERTAKDLVEKGFRITQLNPCVIDKTPRFVPVWEKPAKDAPAREARLELTAKQYEKAAAEFKEKGFRPVEVCGYEVGGEVRFTTIWEKAPGDAPAREAHHNLSSDDYRKLYPALVNKGFRPLRIFGYVVGKETRYATVWEKEPKNGPEWYVQRDLTAKQYQEAFDARREKQLRPIHVCGYTVDGEERFAAVWEASTGTGWFAKHGLDEKEVAGALKDLKNQGYRTVQLSEYAVDGKPRYAGLWKRD